MGRSQTCWPLRESATTIAFPSRCPVRKMRPLVATGAPTEEIVSSLVQLMVPAGVRVPEASASHTYTAATSVRLSTATALRPTRRTGPAKGIDERTVKRTCPLAASRP